MLVDAATEDNRARERSTKPSTCARPPALLPLPGSTTTERTGHWSHAPMPNNRMLPTRAAVLAAVNPMNGGGRTF